MPGRGQRVRRGAGAIFLDRPWIPVLVLLAVVAAYWVAGTRSAPYSVRLVADNGLSLASGMDVQAAGVDVGKIKSVSYENGKAVVELGISDPSVYPLRQGTKAQIRLGSTVGNGNRRIELTPGPRTSPPIPDGGIVGRAANPVPVEIDSVLDTFDPPTRRALSRLSANVSAVLRDRATSDVNDGTRTFDDALRTTAAFSRDVAGSREDLVALLANGRTLTKTLDGRRAQIDALLRVSGATFDTLGRNATAFAATVRDLGPTLRRARGTFDRLPATLDPLGEVLQDLRPGARRLPVLARSTNPLLAELRPLSADGRALVRTAVRSAPDATTLLARTAPVLRKLAPVTPRVAEIVRCVAPYAPELAGFLSNWAGFTQEYDRVSHIGRPLIYVGRSSVTELPRDTTTKAFTDLTQLTYNGIAPPGFFAGEPKYDASCGVGKDATDPANDWDDRP